MKILFIVLLLFSNYVFALEAVVTVLETPMLKDPNLEAQVVQYLRKGDVIKLHPSMSINDAYDHMAPPTEKQKKLQEELEKTPEWQEDKMFAKRPAPPSPDEAFVPILDRLGRKVYVIREHLYIYFENKKELSQNILNEDPTDYRLQEPLPPRYPLFSPRGYRGQATLGVTQPYYESYPYNSTIKTKGYMSPVDLNVTLLRMTPHDMQDRYFFGGTLNLKTFSNSYVLNNGRDATEKALRIGLGPYITYDAFKGVENRVNLYGSINFNFWNQFIIHQSDTDGNEDERIYRGWSITPRLGAQYHRKKIAEDLDFVIGTAIEFEPPTSYHAKNGAYQVSWWQNGGTDEYQTNFLFSLAVYIGIQSAY